MTPLLDALRLTAAPSLAALSVAAVALWLVSLVRRDASIADPAWAPAFLLVAAVSAWAAADSGVSSADAVTTPAAEGPLGLAGPRALLVLALVGAWAGRLGLHLGRRNLSHGEDPRYAAMRAHHGPRFGWVSLFTVFLLQAGLAWIVALPVQAAVASGGPLGPLDLVGAGMAAAGILVEAVADGQLTRFRADPTRRGQVLDTGLWRYSRHPNYFGNAVLWWGLGLLGVSVGAWAGLVGPALMTFLLLRVSGVALLERDIVDRRPAYAAYIRRTSAFLPWFPKGGE